MKPKDLQPDESVEQVRAIPTELINRYWRLARSAVNGQIANGNAAFEMAEILQALFEATGTYPCVLVRGQEPKDCDIALSNVSILAENLWREAQIRFGEENQFVPAGYLEERDKLIDGKTQKLEVKDTPEAGKGLYAKEALKKGSVVFICSGKRKIFANPYESLEMVEVPKSGEIGPRYLPRRSFYSNADEHYLIRPRNPNEHYPNAICIGQEDLEPLIGLRLENPEVKANVWLDPFESCPLRFLNHSCEPNLKRTADGLTFVAMRDIEPDEQVTCDYSTLEVNPHWTMKCQCGSPKCRGTIGGIQSLPTELINQYGTDLPRFMWDLFRESHREVDPEVLDTIVWTRWMTGANQL